VTGKYKILVDANKVRYELIVDRKYTILRGNSAIGKTYFHFLLSKSTSCDVKCDVEILDLFYSKMWKEELLNISNTIYVIDESFEGFEDDEFESILNRSDNYFIIITRRSMSGLPYSVKSIYTLTGEKKYDKLSGEYTLNSISNVYKDYPELVKPDLVITEDSGSGFEFFSNALKGKCDCVASGDIVVGQIHHQGGKDKVADAIRRFSVKYKCICVIVDSAAFGSSIESVKTALDSVNNSNVYVLLPESFEYLLLKSKIFDCKESYLSETYNYADISVLRRDFKGIKGLELSSDCINSWEQFYTLLLMCLAKEFHNGTKIDCEYYKSRLNKYYLRYVNKVLKELKELKF
jgi:hypothetical protein